MSDVTASDINGQAPTDPIVVESSDIREPKQDSRPKKPRSRPSASRNERQASSSAATEETAVVTTAVTPVVTRSAEEILADKAALSQFRILLTELVQGGVSPQTKSPSFWARPAGTVFGRLTSPSLIGGQLSYEELVGKYASLLPVLEQPLNEIHSEMALVGLLALKSGRTKIAQAIYEEVLFLTSSSAALVFVMRGIGRFVRFVVAGVAVVLSCVYFVFWVSLLKDSNETASLAYFVKGLSPYQDMIKVVVACVFGCLGSVVSLLLRLGEFEATKGRSREFLFLSGSTLPFVGAIFAFVVSALLSSNVINFGTTSGKPEFSVWLFVALGFLAGFSERFTRNLLRMAEERFSGPSTNPRPRLIGARRRRYVFRSTQSEEG